MFETVAPEAFESRSRRLLYETLPLSVSIHAVAIAGLAVAALWNIVFPTESPRLVRAYSIVSLPDPPPPPSPPAAQQPQKRVEVPPPEPDKIVAPTVIPDTIPPIPDPPPPRIASLMPAPQPEVTDAVPGGTPGGEIGGEVGGKLHGLASSFFPQDGRVHIDRNQSLPLLIISQEYPLYPEKGKKKQLEDQVVVRYVIGKKGQVIDVQIIDHAREPMFDEAAVDAIRKWRFRPMIKDGQAVEVVHELAVNFELVRH